MSIRRKLICLWYGFYSGDRVGLIEAGDMPTEYGTVHGIPTIEMKLAR